MALSIKRAKPINSHPSEKVLFRGPNSNRVLCVYAAAYGSNYNLFKMTGIYRILAGLCLCLIWAEAFCAQLEDTNLSRIVTVEHGHSTRNMHTGKKGRKSQQRRTDCNRILDAKGKYLILYTFSKASGFGLLFYYG